MKRILKATVSQLALPPLFPLLLLPAHHFYSHFLPSLALLLIVTAPLQQLILIPIYEHQKMNSFPDSYFISIAILKKKKLTTQV
jgi:type IV secretory pathway VirB3-like protein